jgi:hypothetical protein
MAQFQRAQRLSFAVGFTWRLKLRKDFCLLLRSPSPDGVGIFFGLFPSIIMLPLWGLYNGFPLDSSKLVIVSFKNKGLNEVIMNKFALKVIFTWIILSGYLAAQFTPVNLSLWEQKGNPSYGTWTVSEDSSSVRQSENDPPTFFVSPEMFSSATFNGAFLVDSGDDDYIGFVFGFLSPDTIDNFFDFYLFDWKGVTQAGALEGFTLSRVFGTVNVTSGTNTTHPYWDHMDTTQIVLDTYYGDYGWTANREYTFQLIYEPTRVRITIDTTLIFDVSGTFQAGRFGFYNYSQPGVNYRRFYVNDAPVAIADTIRTKEDLIAVFNPVNNDTDSDGHSLEVLSFSEPVNGTVTISDNDSLFLYTPYENFHGTDSIIYRISDGNGAIDSAMIYIFISSVNDTPIASAEIPDVVLGSDTTILHVRLNEYFSDIDLEDAFLDSFTVQSTGTITGYISGSDSLILVSGTSAAHDTITVKVFDDSSASATISFFAGTDGLSAINENSNPLLDYLLQQNYPNPFNPETVISYQLPRSSRVNLKIYDMLGREISTLVNEKQSAGYYSVTFDSKGLPSGIYFYRLNARSVNANDSSQPYQFIRKMILVK